MLPGAVGGGGAVMSIARLSAGAGFRYLLRDTACGDVPRDAAVSLTAYYTDAGYPPGMWWGAGLDGVGADGVRLAIGDVVTEEAVRGCSARGVIPRRTSRSGGPHGVPRHEPADRGRYRRSPTGVGRRTACRGDRRDHEDGVEPADPLGGGGVRLHVHRAEVRVGAAGRLRPGDAGGDRGGAHRDAARDALALVEERALFTRVGARSCAQVSTRGLIAAVFDHWDTRTGDPNLHSHVVIANKVQGLDGLWRSLDSRAWHHAAVAVLGRCTTTWSRTVSRRRCRCRGRTGTAARAARPGSISSESLDLLLAEFSSRSAAITHAVATAVAEFQDLHGRAPSRVETTRLRQRARRCGPARPRPCTRCPG